MSSMLVSHSFEAFCDHCTVTCSSVTVKLDSVNIGELTSSDEIVLLLRIFLEFVMEICSVIQFVI